MIKKIVLTPKTSFSEMFSSDQIWGQFIWAISDLFGAEEASSVVEEFKNNPPMLFSSMFLDGYLPKPFFVNALSNPASENGKHNKKCNWLSFVEFKKLQNDCKSLNSEKLSLEQEAYIKDVNEVHVSIDRECFKALDNGLYNSQYLWCDKALSIYVDFLSNDGKWEKLLNDVVDLWRKIGLGGDKNVGHGQFDFSLEEISTTEESIFDYKESEKYVSLSNCFGSDLVPINYTIDVYSGIVGRVSPTLSAYRKKPLIRYKVGSLFLNGKGCIAENIGIERDVCSYGYVFPVYMNYEG